MKKIAIICLSAVAAMTLLSCNGDDVAIGEPIELISDYQLPQSGASDAANNYIKGIYDKYGSYILYNFSDKDAHWVLTTLTGNSASYEITQGDPQNVEPMVNFLQDSWIKYFPEEFLKKGGIPYRVFLADSIRQFRYQGPNGPVYLVEKFRLYDNALVIGGMNEIPTLTDAAKNVRKIELINFMWTYYTGKKLLSVPDEFYELTDYVTVPSVSKQLSAWSYTFSDEDLIAYRNRGFVPKCTLNSYTGAVSYSEWLMWRPTYTNWSAAKTEDLNAYMSLIFNASDEYMEELLQYPLIKQKWDILLNYYKDNYGIDLRKIALE